MSEKFGLDWKQYDAERITLLRVVHQEIIEAEEKQQRESSRQARQRQ
jgi:hypothetical protein